MARVKRPLERSLVIGSIICILVMSAALFATSYLAFSRWFYKRYNSELAHIITNVCDHIDVDDLQQCVNTGVPSKKFDELQQFLNAYVDDFGLAYLYLSHPVGENMVSVCSATNEEERANGEEDWPLLYVCEGDYTQEELEPYRKAMKATNDNIIYFEGNSEWGACYTACKPLFASDGQFVTLLCADVFIDDLHNALNSYMLLTGLLTVSLGVLFAVLLIAWLRRNVSVPVLKLEESARSFAERSHGRKDPSALLFDTPDIHTENEVESLSNAITKMSLDMRDYVENIIMAEQRAQNAEKEAKDISILAYRDPLTHVKSKTAYEQMRQQTIMAMQSFGFEFALVVIDLNELKHINDTYGHECGDKYLVNTSKLICNIFKHSPVFRIGGDEFLVLLQGHDYESRDELVKQFEDTLAATQKNENVEPWERISAASGMAVYDASTGESYDDVFRRADQTMYTNKVAMKRAKGTEPR